ncbi:MAG: LPS export ABC transporter periplasmic protein LptC [Candidatus Acidiferrales bacterium]
MRTSLAARYARYAALAAILLAGIVAGVYSYRAWQARLAAKKAPPAVPPTVQQRSAGFSFSKVDQGRTLFTVRATRATEFKEGNRNLLEDVWITSYGPTGERYDNMHTQACDYLSDTGRMVCSGEVQLDLESAAEAQQRPGERVLHIATSNVSFDGKSGEAHTDRPVFFRFPNGEGRGAGVTYSSREGIVRLLRNVELTLVKQPGSAGGTGEPVAVTAASLEYRRDTRSLRLNGPVHGRQGIRELSAGELTLELDADLRAQRLVARSDAAGASGQPEVRSAEPQGETILDADKFVVFFHPEGWAERIQAIGNVRGSRKGAAGESGLEAQQLDLEMLPRQNQVRTMTARGNVKAQTSPAAGAGGSRRLETSALQLFFAAGATPGSRRLDRAETLAPATLELQGQSKAGGKTEQETTWLRGQQMSAEFGELNRMKSLTARGGAEVERRLPGRPPQVTSSQELIAKFDRGGDWTELEQSGSVRLREADRAARSDRAHYERSSDLVALAGSIVLTDRTMRTTANSLSFNRRSGEINGQGNVRSTDTSGGPNGVTNFAPEPAHISSDRLTGNSPGGRLLYSGHARLWQGDSVIEADSIELLRDARQLNARGNVLGVFLQAPGTSNGPGNGPGGGSPGGSPGKSSPAKRDQAAAPDLWRVRAATLTYWNGESRARLETNVNAVSRQAQISSPAMELFFSSPEPTAGSAAASGARPGGQQITRAVATGGVTVHQGERRGVSDRADYTAAEGKFVLSGGRPTIYDASRGTTTGRQLTFYFADDRIIVDSEEGSRTLTKHRVEK